MPYIVFINTTFKSKTLSINFEQILSVNVTFFHTLHFANWHFVLRRNFHSIIPSAGFSSRCREYYIWQDREPKLRKMWSNIFYLFCCRGPVSNRSMSIGGRKYEFLEYKIKWDGSLDMQTNWLTLALIPPHCTKLYQFLRRKENGEEDRKPGEPGKRREERRGGHRCFAWQVQIGNRIWLFS